MMFLDVVDDNFGLFQTGSRCFQSCKNLDDFVKFNQDRLVMRKPCALLFVFGRAGHLVDFDLKVMCCMSVIYLFVKNSAVVNSF